MPPMKIQQIWPEEKAGSLHDVGEDAQGPASGSGEVAQIGVGHLAQQQLEVGLVLAL